MSQVTSKILSNESTPQFEDFLVDFYEYVRRQSLIYKNREGMQEENFRQDINHKFRNFFSSSQIDISIENEFALKGAGRVDSLIDKVVVEYKSPGRLKPSNDGAANKEGLAEIEKYISKLSKKENRSQTKYRGIVFDGFYLIFSRFVENRFVSEDPIPFTRASARVFLSTILSIKSERPFTADRLAETFGPASTIAKTTIEAFCACLSNPKKPKTEALFEQWKTNFSQASEFVTNADKALALRDEYRLETQVDDPGLLLFAVHTYLALLMKITAVDVVSQFSSLPSFSKSVLQTTGELFENHLTTLEQGDHFKLAGINNFLEVDYFSWYVSELTPALKQKLQALFLEFEKFDISTLSAEPFLTSDLIKNLYEKLIPKEIRHDLGEYYTPDWLADFVTEETGFTGELGKRALDPSCGSGTFLLSMIRKIKSNCYKNGLNESDTLSNIINCVVGFDLNPLAVIAARTNYLIAISDLLSSIRESETQITIPVYLCDSLLSPKRTNNSLLPEIELETSVGRLTFPTKLAENEVFFPFIEVLRNSIEASASRQDFEAALTREGVELEENIGKLYSKILDLHNQGRNGIWANIIKNSFAPLLEPKFDYIIGNPPWINWEHLPSTYRTNIEHLWRYYGLFTLSGMRALLGGSKKDISSLFTYVCIDHFLKDGGSLGFVITQTLFKNQGSAEGFRKFSLNGDGFATEIPFKVKLVQDFVQIKPFEAANRTAVLILEKAGKTTYPVPYNIWVRKDSARFGNETSIETVKAQSNILACVAEPVKANAITSSWLTLPPNLMTFARQFIGPSHYKAIQGANSGGLNGFYWLTISEKRNNLLRVQNYTKGSKIEVPNYDLFLEGEYIYPQICGRDVGPFKADSKIYTLLLQDPNRKIGVDEKILKKNALRTLNLLNQPKYKKLLEKRSVYTRYYTKEDPHWSMFNVGPDTMKPYKVVWREQSSSMTAAVIGPKKDKWLGKKVVIPDHKLMLIGVDTEAEAHYVCGFLNSFIVRLVVAGYTVETAINTHVLQNVRIPKFDPNDKLHKFLSEKSTNYHSGSEQYEESRFDRELAKILNIDEQVLNDIRKYLE